MQSAPAELVGAAELARVALQVTSLARRVRLARAITPTNWDAEVARLVASRRAGARVAPAFTYAPDDGADAIAAELDALACAFTGRGGPFAAIAARALEIALEARMAAAVGTPALRPLAAARYRSSREEDARARRWAKAHGAAREDDETPTSRSDDERDPASLVSAMRRAVGERRLPVRVLIQPGMAARAAAGDGVVLVGAGQRLRPRDVARTVTHELDGHVAPALARSARGGALAFRLAGDSDREEGTALLCEQRAGFFDPVRRRELAFRHVAACLTHAGAPLHDVADELVALGAEALVSVTIAARAARGGGLGRERVYLPCYWRAAAAEAR